MEANEKIFADGLIVKRKDSAPEWVKANLSVKVEEFKKFLDTHNKNGWVNIDVLQSKGGKLYAEKIHGSQKLKTIKRQHLLIMIVVICLFKF